jgi:hypothetical protein
MIKITSLVFHGEINRVDIFCFLNSPPPMVPRVVGVWGGGMSSNRRGKREVETWDKKVNSRGNAAFPRSFEKTATGLSMRNRRLLFK